MGRPMIAIGVGCRKGCGAAEIVALICRALSTLPPALSPGGRGGNTVLATAARKRYEPGIRAAARLLSLPLVIVRDAALASAQARTVTRSARVAALVGVPSVAEAAALAAVGWHGRLAVTRMNTSAATCAIAFG